VSTVVPGHVEREEWPAWYQNLRGVGDGTSRGAVDLKGLEVLLQKRDILQISQFLYVK
jgi:hypothetical protein